MHIICPIDKTDATMDLEDKMAAMPTLETIFTSLDWP
jgi:hypothetical protein